MPLKTFQNGPERDNLLSYAASDPLLKRMFSDQPNDTDADEQQQRELAQLKKSPEFARLKKLKTQHADGTTTPISDERALQMLLTSRRRLAELKAQQNNGGTQQ